MKLVHAVKMSFLFSVGHIVPYLPRSIMALLARASGVLSRRSVQVRIVKAELRKLLGDSRSDGELERIALKGMCGYRQDLFEIWSFPRLNEKRISKFAYLEGRKHLDKALEDGKGAVVGVSHFGSWKMIIAALAYNGYKINQIGLNPKYFIDKSRPHHHNAVMEMEYTCEQSLPANFIYVGKGKSMRQVFRLLENNEVVLNSFDGFVGSKNIEVPFLNGKVSLSTGPAVVALRSGSPLIPVFAVRQKDNRHRIMIHEEIAIGDHESKQRVVADVVGSFAKLLERYVDEYPSHYGRTLYDRFRDPHRQTGAQR